MSCGRKGHVDCTACGGEVIAGRYVDIVVGQTADAWGELHPVRVPLPYHVLDLTETVMDPTGLVPVICEHGLAEHPNPDIQGGRLGRLGRSWVRSKYALAEGGGLYGKCVVDKGLPRPADLTEVRSWG